MAWNTLSTIICLLSSYIYVYMAAFKSEFEDKTMKDIGLFIEIFFMVDMMLKFLTEYEDKNNN